MEIAIYAMPDSTVGDRLEGMLRGLPSEVSVKRFRTLQKLIENLIDQIPGSSIVVAIVDRPKEFLTLNSLFQSGRASDLILICDGEKETIALAHELRPRFLAQSSELGEVKAVVEKMVSSRVESKQQENNEKGVK